MANLPQTVLPFKLEMASRDSLITALGGVPLLAELFRKLNLRKYIRKYLKVKGKGYKEDSLIEALILLAISGGEHLSDIKILAHDPAFLKLLGKENLPSTKTLERFLKKFQSEPKRPEGVDAWVPEENDALKGLAKVNQLLVKRAIELSGRKTLTLENDATVIETWKKEALFSYKGGKGYQPTIGVISELGLVVADEFRDGNVPAAFDVLGFFKTCFSVIPDSVTRLRFRGDGAYYCHELLDFLRAKKISFTVTMKKNSDWLLARVEAISEDQWQDLYTFSRKGKEKTNRQWAETVWCPADGSKAQMRRRNLRVIVTRKVNHEVQKELHQDEKSQEREKEKRWERYELIGTNIKHWTGEKLVRFHYEKAGSVEQVHDRIKNDLAGSILPCAQFGANAAWYRIQTIAHNLLRILQLHILPKSYLYSRLKTLRFHLFHIAGKVIEKGRQIILRLTKEHPSFKLYQKARHDIAAFSFW